ncbi:unnamed protein product [Gongylonema pulchrum]|uniref:DUF4371 domain-containing protein n=1 Tax=Gongylonema pulchrum TaxID=637853 RepID=A0A183ETI1_9BILA|nr:unnamed protein product [Gongylonema pulchrum]
MEKLEKLLRSDSMRVLNWIHEEKKAQQKFVRNRLEEIRKTDDEFSYVATIDNSADTVSRANDSRKFEKMFAVVDRC